MSKAAQSEGARQARPKSKLLRIRVSSLRLDTIVDFDLYMVSEPGADPVLYRNRHLAITREILERLEESRVKELFIDGSQEKEYRQYVETNLQGILADEAIPVSEKADILYSSAKGLVRDVLDDPKVPGGVRRCKNLVNSASQFVLKNKTAFEHLLRVTSYDYYTYTHSVNVFIYSVVLAQRVGCVEFPQMSQFGLGALLHDIGKSQIAPAILRSRGALTEGQWRIMKQHPCDGQRILEERGGVSDIALDIVRHHHEKLDGSGYPDQLVDGSISPHSRVVAICDIFDALTTRRCYRDAMNSFPSLRLMKEEFAGKIDAEFFRVFVEMMGKPGG